MEVFNSHHHKDAGRQYTHTCVNSWTLLQENGLAAIEHYTQYKTVIVEMNDVDCGLLWSED